MERGPTDTLTALTTLTGATHRGDQISIALQTQTPRPPLFQVCTSRKVGAR
jgi:hypothetical protein